MGPLIRPNAFLTGDRYVSIPPDHLHPIMSIVHSAGLGEFQQDNARLNTSRNATKGLQIGLAIHQNDHQARRRFVEWAQNEIAVVPDFHKQFLFSDEAHLWLNGYVNKQNCR
ncbi:hypothetical protein TNCV_4471241 [Trichonephila clavipes]|uniref:Uncharacterized protein n=1 Tax=Trichonephila clavipes TaxID=2585209 RepID=A0A8X6VKK3_TRICX|nr:hypothetical protein TNCV_4471241 [Trichonephila clavipes]